LTKVKIKDITIEIAEKLKTDESEIKCWEKDLEIFLIKKDTLENENKINTLKSNINTYYRSKAEAARIRSKVNVYEKGEKSTKYFFNLEKKNGQEKLWSKIKTEDVGYKDRT
jgi:hypothetical protein